MSFCSYDTTKWPTQVTVRREEKTMKKTLIFMMLFLALMFIVSCDPVSIRPDPEFTASQETEAVASTPKPTPAIESAVEYLNKIYVISRASGVVSNPKTGLPEPGQYYVGGTPNYPRDKYDMLMLDKDQTEKILEASDLTEITYKQSECLPIMLRWDDVSVIDVYSYLVDDVSAYKAFYYYTDDSTVIIVNDAARKNTAYKNNSKAWITVVPKGKESTYPFDIPPKGTVVSPDSDNKKTFEHYYDDLRAYLMRDSEYVPVKLPPKVYEDYMKDYLKWIEWRAEHPEEYAEWKTLSFKQKNVILYSGSGLFRISGFEWCEAYSGNGAQTVERSDRLPELYYQVREYGIPKEEMQEFVKWQNWSEYFESAALSYDDVEILYSDDEDQVRRHFKSPDVWYYEGELYTRSRIIKTLPACEIAQMFTADSFADFIRDEILDGYVLRGKISAGRLTDIKTAWHRYDWICKEDSGLLTAGSAERVLTGFMDLYRELRYTPDVLAGDPVWRYNGNFLIGENGPYFHLSRKTIGEIELEFNTVFAKETAQELHYILDAGNDKQFDHYPWEGEFSNDLMVSVKPGYYNGAAALYDFEYKLSDHIEIVCSDENYAEVSLTARTRDGAGERTYSVLFFKQGGIWYICGGTVLELLTDF